MNKLAITIAALIASTTAAAYEPNVRIQTPNAYGYGVSADQYGRPVTVTPAPGYATPSNSFSPNTRIEKRNAYGPGISMDQYGRPVTVTPR